MKFMQKLGKSLMLPVAVLPVAAIFVGISNWIIAFSPDNPVASFLGTAGLAVIGNLGLLFCVGVSIGMAKNSDGTSALAGLISWLIVQAILAPDSIASLFEYSSINQVDMAFSKTENVFIGISCGLIAAFAYNKFKDTKLPDALSFFSGKRSVAIVTGGASALFALALIFIWPLIFDLLVRFGEFIVTLGPIGAGIYGLFNRLLIPLGLHHALNSVFWFDVAGINDLSNFQSGDGTFGVTGQYMTGFFPIMMFGVAGAALAMYHTAKSKNKKVIAGLMLSGAFAAFLTGITEPLEFAFMFAAPVLYVIHAVLMGTSLLICALLPVRAGFSFSGGLIDLVLGSASPMAENTWMVIPIGLVYFVLYYVIFRFVIKKFNLKTPGREDDDGNANDENGASEANDDYIASAKKLVEALGGFANITELDNCVTRLRLEIADLSIVNEAGLKKAGAKGVMKPGGHSLQVVMGTKVQFYADAMKELQANPALGENLVEDPAKTSISENDENNSSKKVANPIALPIEGKIIPLTDVPDETFATGIMGEGIAVEPTSGTVISPFDGEVTMIFDTGHAITLTSDDGLELLVHVGIDTVKMNGEGFTKFVKTGDHIKKGDKLIEADLDAIKTAGYTTITPVVVLNFADYDEMPKIG